MEPLPSLEELARQIEGHLQSLRKAGVDWLPNAPVLPRTAVQISTPVPAGTSVPEAVLSTPQSSGPGLQISAPTFLPLEVPVPSTSQNLEKRRKALKLLAEEVKTCPKCAELCSTRTQTVFGQGEPGVELCFVGEAPGADEDAQGIPFVGAAGQLLNKIIQACGLQREEVYICNIIKCRPPGNRTPLPHECSNCRPYLEKQLELVQPKFIVALGGCGATNLLGTTASLGKLRGKFHDYQGIPVMVTYHPAYLLPHRAPDKKKDVWEDMKMLLKRMGRPIPSKSS